MNEVVLDLKVTEITVHDKFTNIHNHVMKYQCSIKSLYTAVECLLFADYKA